MIPKRHQTIFSIGKDFFQAFDFFPSFEPQWWSNCPNMSSSYDSLGNPSYIFHQVLKGRRTDTIMFFFCFYVVLLGRLSLTWQKGGSIWGTFLLRRGPVEDAVASTLTLCVYWKPHKILTRGYISAIQIHERRRMSLSSQCRNSSQILSHPRF